MTDFEPIFGPGSALPLYVAGPCSAESREQILAAARGVARAGVKVFRAGVWKPRTKPGCFEGVGIEALEWLREAKAEYGVSVITEVATPEHLEHVLRAGLDGVWIGARTTTNPFAVQDIADALRGVDTAVLVKNPVSPDVDLWIGSIERIYNSGIRRLGAVHRGFTPYESSIYRKAPPWSVAIELRRRIPYMVLLSDPSHIGGRREFVPSLAQEALDRGFDGVMVECHPTPDCALSDAAQQIVPEELATMLNSLVWRRTHVAANDLRDYRMHIDAVDNRILELLTERMDIAREIGRFKREHNMAVVQRERFNELLLAAEARAEATGLSKRFIHRMFSAIHEESVRQQLEDANLSERL